MVRVCAFCFMQLTYSKASRDKGKRGERELAAALNAHGYDCRRGQQYSGANGDADVVGLDGIHLSARGRSA